MRISLGYAKEKIQVNIPEKNLQGVLAPNTPQVSLSEEESVRQALLNPIDSPLLKETITPGEKIVIVTSDITRPIPTAKILPFVVEQLNQAGIPDRDIAVVFGLGVHRPHTAEEQAMLVGQAMYARLACFDSTPEDTVHLGETSRGTPIDLSRRVVEADRCICLGNIEYHYFAGVSGGMKAIMPGVSTRAAIQANHSRMVEAQAMAGKIEDNPVREDIDEVAQFFKVAFIVNVVLDEKKKIIKAFAGDVLQAHRAGCAYLDSLYKVEIETLADIVIVTPGGFPKDINLYQAQKALDNAKHAVKKGGVIILLAACSEGLGEHVFERWLLNAPNPHFMVTEIQRNFELGGHKAAAIAMVMENASIFLVSEFSPEFTRKMFMTPFPDFESALRQALQEKGEHASILVMPYGGSTLPVMRSPGK
ncbi:hypothetical protein U27_00899 [Candidatus Vecturithrix granuli]|uniref:Uncharacterized protein n=1 Tax=Vecturithrix granuli TaxID=1499967 RepID=A0A081C8U6_VECG1|nr:hypothetical protein U27_00899 [Candidatus Vecturithrix granuli]